MRRLGQWLPRALFESFLIVISILLALAVNEWRDNRARLTRAAEARTAFANEIRANRDLVLSDPILPHHKRLQAEYQKLAQAASTEPGSLFETGVHPAALRDAAWRSFSTGSTLVDFAPDEVVLLSDIYRAQEDLAQLNSGYMNAIRTPRADRETPEFMRDTNRSISMYLNDVVPLEERLLKVYGQALDKLASKSPR
jgi:hypothetical protein